MKIDLPQQGLGIARVDMSQISSKDVPDFVKFLNGRGVRVQKRKAPVGQLKMTQLEINTDKVVKLMGAESSNLSKVVLVSKDMFILDGHHRIAALFNKDKYYRVDILHVDLKIQSLLKVAREYPKMFHKTVNEMLSLQEFVSDYKFDDLEFMDCLDEEFYEFIDFRTVEETLSEKAKSDSDGVQPWKSLDEPTLMKAKNPEQAVAVWMDKHVKPLIDKAYAVYGRGMKRVAQKAKGSKVILDVKKPKSILSKIIRGKDVTEMHDILRGTILVKTEEDVESVDKYIGKVFKLYKREIKSNGGDKNYGYYGSFHYLVDIDGVLAEIQLMTRSLWNVKHKAHDIYKDTREKVKNDPNFAKSSEFAELQKLSKKLFSRGNIGKGVAIR